MGKKWECWVLSEEDIEDKCKELGIDFEELTGNQIEEIARGFKKDFEDFCEDWDLILGRAIQEVKK